jgi:Fic family protein
MRLHDLLPMHPYVTAGDAVRRTGMTAPTVNAALADLVRLKIVDEVTGRRRGRVFAYRAYLDILGEGTAPLPATAA